MLLLFHGMLVANLSKYKSRRGDVNEGEKWKNTNR